MEVGPTYIIKIVFQYRPFKNLTMNLVPNYMNTRGDLDTVISVNIFAHNGHLMKRMAFLPQNFICDRHSFHRDKFVLQSTFSAKCQHSYEADILSMTMGRFVYPMPTDVLFRY